MLRNLLDDARSAYRAIRTAPLTSAAIGLTLALGIGSTLAIFSVINGLLLRPLPVPDPQRLVTVTSAMALRFGFQAGAGWNDAMWNQLRQRDGAFDGAFAWTLETMNRVTGGEAQPIEVLVASGGLFSTLRVAPILGRPFTPEDDAPDGGPAGGVVVISYAFWQRHLGGSRDVLGAMLVIEGAPLTIVGVMPAGFTGLDVGQPFDVALPLGAETLIRGPDALVNKPGALLLTVMLRLRPGQSIQEATAVLRAMQPGILADFRTAPAFLKEPFILQAASAGITDRSGARQKYERPLLVLLIVASLVLAAACLNIANLMLARTTARRHEFATRLALGASRVRLARHVVIESIGLAAPGIALGGLTSVWLGRAIVSHVPATQVPLEIGVSLDGRELGCLALAGLISVAAIATLPALRVARLAPAEVLRDGRRGVSARRWRPVSRGLISAQVAVSMILLTGMAFFVRTLDRLAAVPLGLDVDHVEIVDIDATRLNRPQMVDGSLQERAAEAIAAIAGVDRAAASTWTPLGSGGGLMSDARGRSASVSSTLRTAYNFVTPHWFEVYGIARRDGRDFDTSDDASTPCVAAVNESLAAHLFPDGHALGGTVDAGTGKRCRVVGVVADSFYGRSLRDAAPPTLFIPLAQSAGLTLQTSVIHVSVRTGLQPAPLRSVITAALSRLDPSLTFAIRPFRSDVDAAFAQERIMAFLSTLFGSVALMLSAIGLYAVTAYGVARSRNEIGIRQALGASPSSTVRLFLRRASGALALGLTAGVVASAYLSRLVTSLLYGTAPSSPGPYVTAAAILAAVALTAAWVPARQAARIDPATVLREQ